MAEQSQIPIEERSDHDLLILAVKGVNDLVIQNGNFHEHCQKKHDDLDRRQDAQDEKISSILTKVYWILGVLAVAGTGTGIAIKWG
jgi:hypothetical protein